MKTDKEYIEDKIEYIKTHLVLLEQATNKQDKLAIVRRMYYTLACISRVLERNLDES